MSTIRRHALLACACALLAACTPLTPPPALSTPVPAPVPVPAQPALPQDARVLQIAPQESLLTITVRRSGPLARLGHDHVIASHTLQGTVAPALGRTEFQFRLDELSVDEEGLRQKAGLTTTPSADAIAGTRHNMLVRVLDAERYPWVHIAARRTGDSKVLEADITLHGVTRTVPVSAEMVESADGSRLQASGKLLLKQSDFGITPFAILGGAMAVQDQMELAFRITAIADGKQQLSAPGSGASPGR
ncbi:MULTISPECIES: YceI family protein [unclassified Janthinobacterium]|uniref:YceI family protein n=1 Tax=unclassified Janthinobacterium TaxID=2610881 RepID=UPI0017BE372B|nr:MULTISPECIES: YceI family protein [unclassified Janthinobacterium]MBB5609193.1 polyisoprenoid-binding protein YceI [Janthinobacterium sp. S3T4]MBB5614366.1 polyisoprenoid-binding protein YceI [Janthinobacterium sp. S3M3]